MYFYGNLGLRNIIWDMYRADSAKTLLKSGVCVEVYHAYFGRWVIKATRPNGVINDADILALKGELRGASLGGGCFLTLPELAVRGTAEVIWLIDYADVSKVY